MLTQINPYKENNASIFFIILKMYASAGRQSTHMANLWRNCSRQLKINLMLLPLTSPLPAGARGTEQRPACTPAAGRKSTKPAIITCYAIKSIDKTASRHRIAVCL